MSKTNAVTLVSRKIAGDSGDEPEDPEERRARRRKENAKAAREREEFRRSQPLKALPRRDLPRQFTLRAAHELLLSYDCAVTAGPHGTLSFAFPALFGESAFAEQGLRSKLEAAAQTLDACRELVHAALVADETLPDAEPALGGAIVCGLTEAEDVR